MDEYLVVLIFVVLIFFSAGLSIYNNPRVLNSFYGYRTHASKRNQDTWDEANIYAGKCIMTFCILIILSLIVTNIVTNNVYTLLKTLLISSLISLGCVLFLTENRLKQVFYRDGKRRPNR